MNELPFRSASFVNRVFQSVRRRFFQEDLDVLRKIPLRTRGINSNIRGPYTIMNPQYISIGDNFRALHNLRIEAWDRFGDDSFKPEIVIGDNVIVNSDVHIGCINRVEIGNNVLMASRIYISDTSHGEISPEALKLPPRLRPLVSKGPVIIEDNVWIGEGACVMPGVRVGLNAIIGANSVVTRDVPRNAVVAGAPARIVKMLDDAPEISRGERI